MSFNAQKAISNRVILLSGAEDYLVRRALAEILVGAGFEKDDYDLEVFNGDSSSAVDWCASAGTAPFLATRRGVVVRNVLRAKVEEMQPDAFGGLPSTALLVLVADDDQSEERNSKVTSRKKALEKMVTTASGVLANFASDPKKSNEMIRVEVHARGKKISGDAIEALVEMTGGGVSRALEELDKILLYSRNDVISEGDVRSVVVPSREWNIWRMLDAMTQGNVAEALNQMRTVVASNKKPEELAFSLLFPQISRQLRLLMQARICLDAGVEPENAPPAITLNFPSKNYLPTEKSFVQNSSMRAARQLSLRQISQAMGLLSDADASLKGMGVSFSAMDTIERLIFDLAATLNPKKA